MKTPSAVLCHRAGQSMIGLLVSVLILFALGFLLLGGRRGADGESRPSVVKQSIDHSKKVGVGTNYTAQIQSLVEMYKEGNDGKPPASLAELRAYGKRDFPDEMWVDPVTKQPLNYDPATGIVSSPTTNAAPPSAVSPPSVSPPAASVAPPEFDADAP